MSQQSLESVEWLFTSGTCLKTPRQDGPGFIHIGHSWDWIPSGSDEVKAHYIDTFREMVVAEEQLILLYKLLHHCLCTYKHTQTVALANM